LQRSSYYIINGITLYRLIAAPFLLFIVFFAREAEPFKWLLAVSFFTDAIDGYLARRYKVVSVLGARLDSLGDDLTVVAGTIGLFVFKPEFIAKEYPWLLFLFCLFIVQFILALSRYGKVTSFHTLLAKIAAVFQGSFLILSFFVAGPLYFLFYCTIFVTALELLEEIILIFLLPRWKANVKGIYWVLKQD
jgi:phosphatidylglycerophosphate synthase